MERQLHVSHFCSATIDANYFEFVGNVMEGIDVKQTFITTTDNKVPKWVAATRNVGYFALHADSRILYPLAVVKLAMLLRRERIDILQTHLFDAALIGILAQELVPSCKLIVSRHHLDETSLLGSKLHVGVDKWTNRSADLVIVPSEATKRYMSEVEGQDVSKVRVIQPGIDLRRMDATEENRIRVREEFGLTDNFVIGCVGRFFKNKGHRYLLEALAEIVPEFPQVRLLLCGKGERASIEADIIRLNLEGVVIFAGYRDDLPACMKAMDLLVHPSLSESFGRVIVEAMGVGIPVVATSVGGVPEIFSDGYTGIVVPPADAGRLKNGILEMLMFSDKRMGFARAGQKSVQKKFSVESFIDKQWAAYQEVLG